jgi:hypothetical protein
LVHRGIERGGCSDGNFESGACGRDKLPLLVILIAVAAHVAHAKLVHAAHHSAVTHSELIHAAHHAAVAHAGISHPLVSVLGGANELIARVGTDEPARLRVGHAVHSAHSHPIRSHPAHSYAAPVSAHATHARRA